MRVIKRYSNRKLYDSLTSKTVTLDDIAQMIREGEDIQVIDSSTEKDITNKILSQVFIRDNFDTKQILIKKVLLQGLIKESSGKIESLLKKFMLAGIGLATLTSDRIDELVNELVKRGELAESERARFVKDLMDKMPQQPPPPPADELALLKEKIDQMSATIDALKRDAERKQGE